MRSTIPVSQPLLGEEEYVCVTDALRKGAISGFYGEYLPKFENDFAHYSDCTYGVATSSGTSALHLAMATLGIGPGDEVLVPTLTNMATCFAVIYQGATPVPIDIEADTLNIDTELLEKKINRRTRAIVVVHLFGHAVDMDPVIAVAKAHNLFLIEDCAEAHGALYRGKKVGSFGNIGCFSFYANKIITTGEGGMITTNDPELAAKARMLKELAFGEKNKFMHREIGFNYRMTNIQAALGYAQLQKIEAIISSKREIAQSYCENLEGITSLQLPVEKAYARHVYWMYHVALCGTFADKRQFVMSELRKRYIETRECFVPYNMQEIFIRRGWTKPDECPKANDIATRGFYLPSGPSLAKEDLDYVVSNVRDVLEGK